MLRRNPWRAFDSATGFLFVASVARTIIWSIDFRSEFLEGHYFHQV